ncbi:SNF2 family DNA-dependent ATPase [Armillaria novae-zelandiae]|uniref:Chromatin-remodeling ATPase INO80 n=1 Tax=Armillaria novae-zelandiae TaxID=153914 RepID=A0AA39P6I5_9AGAR|nr:SNF2 family DNA-dependent ATPase [Armillaria novae-zelandiae]
MSLSRILNDEPSPALSARSTFTSSSRNMPIDAVQRDIPSPSAFPNASPRSQSRMSDSYRSVPPLPRVHGRPLPNHDQPDHWDPYLVPPPRNSMAATSSSVRSELVDRERDINRSASPDGQIHFSGSGAERDSVPRKRHKGDDDDNEYRVADERRHQLFNSANRSQDVLPDTLPNQGSPARRLNEDVKPRPSKHMNEEDRLASSDLSDCEEVWFAELSDYILETQKRFKQVQQWFNESTRDRTAKTAEDMSHYYSRKIAKIPMPPPSPPPMLAPPDSPRFNGYEYPDVPIQDTPDRDGLYMSPGPDMNNTPEPNLSIRLGKGKERAKRQASGAMSDESSELYAPTSRERGHASKKRKLEASPADMLVDATLNGELISPAIVSKTSTKGKGKAKQQPSPAQIEINESASSNAKPPRKRPGPRKRLPFATDLEMELTSHPPSIAGDATPSVSYSRPSSPAPTNSTVIFELDEEIPPLKKARKLDDGAMVKRVKALEDAQRKVWTNIARRDVAKVYKYHALGYQARVSQSERIAKLASIQARKPFTKTPKGVKDTQAKARRLMREMQVFWKKNEREERDVRKREHKEAMDRLKMEEEKREAARQARKLEFLISQTELYSHFVGNKLKTSEMEGESSSEPPPAGADFEDINPETLGDINFDDDDKSNMYRHAKHNAQEAIALAKQKAEEFDAHAARERKNNEANQLVKSQLQDQADGEAEVDGETGTSSAPLLDLDSDELNFQNPTSLSGPLTIGQPKMLMAQLKEYQLKGLNWLATLYEQGINGILADEMGLGKTVQSISLLSYLAETHDIWGPFLVVAPASTLHNWQQEITRFVPRLKALPYWGNVKDRATLRKFWSKKEISYNQDAPFHVLITSYQLVTQDQQYFQRVKWQYMILDEAQNIKNSSSVRWKTLLGFQCRNRLLLTGTPIQNSMQELWALLHFIMPSLFDSHDEFNEWFSKDIENAAENRGSKLNEHQLRRLHMILKPFMLRRVKKHVQNELSEKIEEDIYVSLSARQRSLYKALLAKVSVADLIAKAANIGDADSARTLMNLVMQFRKVCNHPELFERADVVVPFSFSRFGRPGPVSRDGDFINLPYSTHNPIEYTVPELLYRYGGVLDVPSDASYPVSRSSCLTKLMNIWSTDWIHRSIYDGKLSTSFAFLSLLAMSPQEAHTLHVSPLVRRRLSALRSEHEWLEEGPFYMDSFFAAHSARPSLEMSVYPSLQRLDRAEGLPGLFSISRTAWTETCLSRSEMKWFVPAATAPPISLCCTDRTFMDRHSYILDSPLESLGLYGAPLSLRDSMDACTTFDAHFPGLSCAGLFATSPSDQVPLSTMQVPEAKRLIYDSAKLARLDTLLQELKAGDHRVLVYFQMTRMMDLMEEYLIYRQYKYLRLDGSSKLEDRRDMVIDWQTKPDIFVFLLSTRAGGLGINLTAADTVVFYDHDWNPSNDAQAMDRAHRLGQTRQVTVYRLITKGTIDERIIQLARVKKDVQDIVVGNKNLTDVAKPSEIVQLLLNDEQFAGLDTSATAELSSEMPANGSTEPIRDLWDEEGDDDFFGHSNSAVVNGQADAPPEENGDPVPSSGRGRKRKTGTRGGRRGGKRKAGIDHASTPVLDYY